MVHGKVENVGDILILVSSFLAFAFIKHACSIGSVCSEQLEIAGTFDRVVMPMPHTNEYFLTTALPATNMGGRLHFYFFDSEAEVRRFADGLPARIAAECGRQAHVEHIQRYMSLLLQMYGVNTTMV